MLKPLANGREIVECSMLRPFALPAASFCVLLGVAAWFELNRSNFRANNSQRFFCSVIAEAWRNNNVGGKLIEISKDCQSLNQSSTPLFECQTKGLFTWSGGPRSSEVGFFCFHALGDTKQKKPTPLNRGPPLHVNRV